MFSLVERRVFLDKIFSKVFLFFSLLGWEWGEDMENKGEERNRVNRGECTRGMGAG